MEQPDTIEATLSAQECKVHELRLPVSLKARLQRVAEAQVSGLRNSHVRHGDWVESGNHGDSDP